MDKMKELCMSKENLVTWFNSKSCNGSCIEDMEDVQVMGAVMDMIKDAAQAEKECVEAEYYKTVIKAMKEGQEREEADERFGYNSNRYANGRYAPSGYGNHTNGRSGMTTGYSYGYSGGNGRSGGSGSSSNSGQSGGRGSNTSQGGYGYHMSTEGASMWDGIPEEFDPRYGEAYNKYRSAMRHYTQSRSEHDKNEVNQHATEHMNDLADTFKEIYQNVDPAMKAQLKSEMTKLVNEMSTM